MTGKTKRTQTWKGQTDKGNWVGQERRRRCELQNTGKRSSYGRAPSLIQYALQDYTVRRHAEAQCEMQRFKQ